MDASAPDNTNDNPQNSCRQNQSDATSLPTERRIIKKIAIDFKKLQQTGLDRKIAEVLSKQTNLKKSPIAKVTTTLAKNPQQVVGAADGIDVSSSVGTSLDRLECHGNSNNNVNSGLIMPIELMTSAERLAHAKLLLQKTLKSKSKVTDTKIDWDTTVIPKADIGIPSKRKASATVTKAAIRGETEERRSNKAAPPVILNFQNTDAAKLNSNYILKQARSIPTVTRQKSNAETTSKAPIVLENKLLSQDEKLDLNVLRFGTTGIDALTKSKASANDRSCNIMTLPAPKIINKAAKNKVTATVTSNDIAGMTMKSTNPKLPDPMHAKKRTPDDHPQDDTNKIEMQVPKTESEKRQVKYPIRRVKIVPGIIVAKASGVPNKKPNEEVCDVIPPAKKYKLASNNIEPCRSKESKINDVSSFCSTVLLSADETPKHVEKQRPVNESVANINATTLNIDESVMNMTPLEYSAVDFIAQLAATTSVSEMTETELSRDELQLSAAFEEALNEEMQNNLEQKTSQKPNNEIQIGKILPLQDIDVLNATITHTDKDFFCSSSSKPTEVPYDEQNVSNDVPNTNTIAMVPSFVKIGASDFHSSKIETKEQSSDKTNSNAKNFISEDNNTYIKSPTVKPSRYKKGTINLVSRKKNPISSCSNNDVHNDVKNSSATESSKTQVHDFQGKCLTNCDSTIQHKETVHALAPKSMSGPLIIAIKKLEQVTAMKSTNASLINPSTEQDGSLIKTATKEEQFTAKNFLNESLITTAKKPQHISPQKSKNESLITPVTLRTPIQQRESDKTVDQVNVPTEKSKNESSISPVTLKASLPYQEPQRDLTKKPCTKETLTMATINKNTTGISNFTENIEENSLKAMNLIKAKNEIQPIATKTSADGPPFKKKVRPKPVLCSKKPLQMKKDKTILVNEGEIVSPKKPLLAKSVIREDTENLKDSAGSSCSLKNPIKENFIELDEKDPHCSMGFSAAKNKEDVIVMEAVAPKEAAIESNLAKSVENLVDKQLVSFQNKATEILGKLERQSLSESKQKSSEEKIPAMTERTEIVKNASTKKAIPKQMVMEASNTSGPKKIIVSSDTDSNDFFGFDEDTPALSTYEEKLISPDMNVPLEPPNIMQDWLTTGKALTPTENLNKCDIPLKKRWESAKYSQDEVYVVDDTSSIHDDDGENNSDNVAVEIVDGDVDYNGDLKPVLKESDKSIKEINSEHKKQVEKKIVTKDENEKGNHSTQINENGEVGKEQLSGETWHNVSESTVDSTNSQESEKLNTTVEPVAQQPPSKRKRGRPKKDEVIASHGAQECDKLSNLEFSRLRNRKVKPRKLTDSESETEEEIIRKRGSKRRRYDSSVDITFQDKLEESETNQKLNTTANISDINTTPTTRPKMRGRKPKAKSTEEQSARILTPTVPVSKLTEGADRDGKTVKIYIPKTPSTCSKGRRDKTSLEADSSDQVLKSFNSRLLLIRKREQLDTNEPLTVATGNGPLQCGLCLAYTTKEAWIDHLAEHYGVGWLAGQSPLNVDNRAVVLNSMTLFFRDTGIKGIACRLCLKQFRSALGVLTHIELCGKEKERVECQYCKRSYTKLSHAVHVRTCSARLVNIENENENEDPTEEFNNLKEISNDIISNSGRVKRVSTLKAETKLKQIGKELIGKTCDDDLPKFSPAEHILHVKPTNLQKELSKWQEHRTKFGVAYCKNNNCNFSSSDISQLEQHKSECAFKLKPGYYCKICNDKNIYESEKRVLEHIVKSHQPKTGFDSGSSDYEIGFDKESSEEYTSSGVDSDEDDVQTEESDMELENDKKKKTHKSEKQNAQQRILFARRNKDFDSETTEKWKEFFEHSESKKLLYTYALPDPKIVPTPEVEKFLPQNSQSAKFFYSNQSNVPTHFGSTTKPENKNWIQLQRFAYLNKTNEHVWFMGAAIRKLIWAPLPASVKEQYLVCTYRKALDYTSFAKPKIKPNIIMVLKVCPGKTNKHWALNTSIQYGIQVKDGPVHSISFMASGGYDTANNRLGLLAVGTAKPKINIYALPIQLNKCSQTSGDELQIIDLTPVMVLTFDLEAENPTNGLCTHMQCLSIAWSEVAPHDFIVAGFSNGCIAFWNIEEVDNLNLFMIDGVRNFVPLNYFYFGEKNIRCLALHYDKDGVRWLAGASSNRLYQIYDIKNITEPILLCSDILKQTISCIDWPAIWETVTFGCADVLVKFTARAVAVNPAGVSFKHSTIDQTLCTVQSIHLHYDEHVQVYGCDNGDVAFINAREMNLETSLHRRIQRVVSFCDVEPLSNININEHESVKPTVDEVTFNENYALVYTPLIKVPNEIKNSKYLNSKRQPPMNLLPFLRINSVRCNSNGPARKWVALGCENGLIRILNFKKKPYF